MVLRLLAVYFGAAALLLFLAHRFVRRLAPFPVLVLTLAPFLLTGKALLTAGVYAPLEIAYAAEPLAPRRSEMGVAESHTPLLSDVVYSYLPGRKAVREALKNGRLPLWNRFHMAGEPLLAFQQPAVFHPGTWIGFLLPLAQAWTFEMAFRLLIALLAAYLFFRDLPCSEWGALLGAAGWAFCDHLVFFLGYSVTAAVAPFPLLLLGLRRLARDGDRRAVGLTVVSLVLIAVSGHPETLLHTVAGGGIYFLFELFHAPRRERRRAFLLALLAGALCLGLTAVVLLPFLEILPYTWAHAVRTSWYATLKKSVAPAVSLHLSVRNLLPYAFGVSGHGAAEAGFGLPASYAGSLLVPLALMGLKSRRREKWCFLLLALLGFALWARFVVVTDLVAKLPLFDIAINDYLVFLGSFGTVALAVLGFDRLIRGEGVIALAAMAAGCALLLTLLYLRIRPKLLALPMPADYLRWRILLQTLPLILAAGLLYAAHRRRKLVLGASGVLLIFLVQRGLEAGEVYPTYSSRSFYPKVEILEKIPRGSPERIVAVGYTLVPNVSAMYELEDVRGYEAMVLAPLVETFPLWCVEQPVWYNRVDDPTRPFLAFLNVRYLFAGRVYQTPPGWVLLAESAEGRIFENPRAAPRAFAPAYVGYVKEPERQREILSRVTDFTTHGIVERTDEPSADSETWIRNGRAEVDIASYTPQKMRLEIQATEPSLVATSIPRWPGWKLVLDGRKIPALPYNRAFLSFRVPAGRHRVELRYFPDGFRDGLAVSALALAVSIILLRWPRSNG
jgi:hypothetical protein